MSESVAGASGTQDGQPLRVALMGTCLVELFRPGVALAAGLLLERGGCIVEIPAGQTCCGQPAYNSGDRAGALRVARKLLKTFAGYPYVVVPSGSCAGMLARHLPLLFPQGSDDHASALSLAGRVYELTVFLKDVLKFQGMGKAWPAVVTYHDSCAGLRELTIREQPRALLGQIAGLTLREMKETEVCCGFGGMFCVKYPEISVRMARDKLRAIEESEATTLLAGDLGCLLHLAGVLARRGSRIEVRHIAEVLAGLHDSPAIGRANERADKRANERANKQANKQAEQPA